MGHPAKGRKRRTNAQVLRFAQDDKVAGVGITAREIPRPAMTSAGSQDDKVVGAEMGDAHPTSRQGGEKWGTRHLGRKSCRTLVRKPFVRKKFPGVFRS